MTKKELEIEVSYWKSLASDVTRKNGRLAEEVEFLERKNKKLRENQKRLLINVLDLMEKQDEPERR
jgi:hypothetical protein